MNEEQFRKLVSQGFNTSEDDLQIQAVGSTSAYYVDWPTWEKAMIIGPDMQYLGVDKNFPQDKLVEAWEQFRQEQETTGESQH